MKTKFLTTMLLLLVTVSFSNTIKTEHMKPLNDKEFAELAKTHGDIYELPVGDKIAYLREPNMQDYKRAFTAMQKGGDVAFGEAMLQTLFVAGDKEILKEDDYFLPARKELTEFFNYDDAITNELDNGRFKIEVGDESCEVRKISREDLKTAERHNPSGKPFVTQEKLFELVCLDKSDGFTNKKDAKLWFPLFQAIEQLQNQKVAILKKRSPMPS